MLKYNKNLIAYAKELRKNMTPWEIKLWNHFLRMYPIRFQRQKVIDNYIADFYCAKAKLVIELDGGQHFEEDVMQYDAVRTGKFAAYGLRVLRIPNNEIHDNFDNVCEYIDDTVRKLCEIQD